MSGEPINMLTAYRKSPRRRWRYDGTHGSREASCSIGQLEDPTTWYVWPPKSDRGTTHPTEGEALAAVEEAMAAYHRTQVARPYTNPFEGDGTGFWVEVPVSDAPRRSYGERPGERFEP